MIHYFNAANEWDEDSLVESGEPLLYDNFLCLIASSYPPIDGFDETKKFIIKIEKETATTVWRNWLDEHTLHNTIHVGILCGLQKVVTLATYKTHEGKYIRNLSLKELIILEKVT